jgi:3-methyladenine DNA glycosylase/8-oxoguanine DNA glycosylase
MRGLHDPDALPPTDLGVRQALLRSGHDGRPTAAEGLAERWGPYLGYTPQHLWAFAGR